VDAVHEQLSNELTSKPPEPPSPATDTVPGHKLKIHGIGPCVTNKRRPPIQITPWRLTDELLTAATYVTACAPVLWAPPVTVSQADSLRAFHRQPAGADTRRLFDPPLGSIVISLTDSGSTQAETVIVIDDPLAGPRLAYAVTTAVPMFRPVIAADADEVGVTDTIDGSETRQPVRAFGTALPLASRASTLAVSLASIVNELAAAVVSDVTTGVIVPSTSKLASMPPGSTVPQKYRP
jgi:hypothetical protein